MSDAALQERESPARWLVCLLLVLLAHGGAGLFLLSRTLLPAAEVTVPAVMLDLAPITTPPPAETLPAETPPPNRSPSRSLHRRFRLKSRRRNRLPNWCWSNRRCR